MVVSMEEELSSGPQDSIASQAFWNLTNLIRNLFFAVLSVGPIPKHMAFILDGNRRFAKKWNLTEGGGHNAGFLAVIRVLKYCYELGIKYVTIYAFSIDNYRRKPEEVQLLMNLMKIKMDELLEVEGLVHRFGVRVYFSGNLELLRDPMKSAVHRIVEETAKNTRAVLCVCLPYTSTDEITHSIQMCFEEKWRKSGGGIGENGGIGEGGDETRFTLGDLERNMYMAVAPEPDILVRTSGETRLSNFLLWQSSVCWLYSPATLWPEIGLWDLVWSVLNFQRSHSYVVKKKGKLLLRYD